MERVCEKFRKIFDIIRYILSFLLIIAGIGEIKNNLVLEGIFLIIFAISLMPIIYNKFKLKKYEKIQIILPIICFIGLVIVTPHKENNIETASNETVNNIEETVQNDKGVNISKLEIKEKEVNINSTQTQSVEIYIFPNNAININNIQFISEDNSILEFKKDEEKSTDLSFYGKIIPKKDGITNIYVLTDENIKSNIVKVTIKTDEIQKSSNTDNTGITSNKTSNTNTNSSNTTSKSSSSIVTQSVSAESTDKKNSMTVYITPTGERYHLDPDCGGKNSYSITLSEAISRGYTPCKKCAK